MASNIQAQFDILTSPGGPYEMVEVEMFGHGCRAFKNAPETLRDLYAETVSDAEFFIFENERLTFQQSWDEASRLGHALVNQYGVSKGDRVAISMRNYPEWIIAFMAVTSVGGIACALNALWQSDEIAFALND